MNFVSWLGYPEYRKVGPVDNFCVSDKVIPAYPEDHTLGTHVEDLELP